jgi:hypothetical protein
MQIPIRVDYGIDLGTVARRGVPTCPTAARATIADIPPMAIAVTVIAFMTLIAFMVLLPARLSCFRRR